MKLTSLLVPLIAVLWSGVVGAKPGVARDVAVVVGEPDDRLVRSLLASLAESHVGARGSVLQEPSLARIAAIEGVVAVVRVPPAHDALEIWLASLQAGRPLLDVRLRANGDEESLILQCVELLRGQRKGASDPHPSTDNAPAPTEPLRAQPSEISPRTAQGSSAAESGLRLELGVGYNLASSQVHWASFESAVGLIWNSALTTLRVSLPGWGATVEQPEGHALVHSPALALATDWMLRRSTFAVGAGPVLGVRLLRISGTDSSATVKDQRAFLLEAGAEARVEYGALPGARGFFKLRAGYLMPEARLRFSGADRAGFGPIVLGAELGLALGSRP